MNETIKVTTLWYSSNSWLSRVIKWVTGSSYSHVAVMASGAIYVGARGDDDVLYEALGSGIVKRHNIIALKRATEAAAVYVEDVDATLVRNGLLFLDAKVKRVDHPYAYWWDKLLDPFRDKYSVTGFIAAGVGRLTGWRWKIALDGEYICSGLAARFLEFCGHSFRHDAETMTPADLADELGVEN